MSTSRCRHLLLLGLAAILVSCGDQSLFLSLSGGSSSDIQITSVTDGKMVTAGAILPLVINAPDSTKDKIEVEVTLTSSTGDVVVPPVRAAAALNKETGITLPSDLAPGLYRLDIVVYANGEVTQKKSSSFFVAPDGFRINGITSFPPLVTVKSSVMLKADLQYPTGTNPWLRWSWKGKAIAKGSLADGYDEVLWTAPSDEGVYAISLEVFPVPPVDGSDFPFPSTLQLTTDVFVSGGKAEAKGDLGPESSYLVLLHLQGNLTDVGTGVRTSGVAEAVPVGKPEVVSLEDGFGYRLDGTSGIRLAWLGLPVDAGNLQPFTLSFGVSFDDPATAGTIVSARAADGSFSLDITMDAKAGGPRAALSVPGIAPFEVPWGGSPIPAAKRSLLSLSITPRASSMTAQWFIDGTQVGSASTTFAPAGVRQKGTLTVGGDKGFKGVVDEVGVYTTDPEGRPSTDPDQYRRAAEALYGTNLVFADGFDGTWLPAGFAVEGSGQISAGLLLLKPGSGLDMPALSIDGTATAVTISLPADSRQAAVLQARWQEGGTAAAPFAVPADASAQIRFTVAADGRSLVIPAGAGTKTVALDAPPSGGAPLILTLSDPVDAPAALAIDQVLAVSVRK